MSKALDYTTVPAPPAELPAKMAALHATMREADGIWRAARAMRADDGLVRDLCCDFIEAAHSYQRARWGRVRCPLTVPGLLR